MRATVATSMTAQEMEMEMAVAVGRFALLLS